MFMNIYKWILPIVSAATELIPLSSSFSPGQFCETRPVFFVLPKQPVDVLERASSGDQLMFFETKAKRFDFRTDPPPPCSHLYRIIPNSPTLLLSQQEILCSVL